MARLRGYGLLLPCGLYPKMGPSQFAAEFLPGTPVVQFGKHGGLVEMRCCEPLSVPDPGSRWSPSEDYAFCIRTRQAGFVPVADTPA